jgi:putative Holliday junction resolvase
MKYLGLDYGTRRIGIAISDDTGSLAFPLTVIQAGQGSLEQVAALVKEHAVEKIIIGESRDFKGEANAVMEDITQFKKDLEELSAMTVEFEREFFTSTMAARQFAPQQKSRKANPPHDTLDASAAALILQSYLDRNKNK